MQDEPRHALLAREAAMLSTGGCGLQRDPRRAGARGPAPGTQFPPPGTQFPPPENYVRHAARRRLASNAGWGAPAGLCPAAGSRMVLAGGGAGALHGAGAQVNFLVLLLTHQAIGFSCLFFFFSQF